MREARCAEIRHRIQKKTIDQQLSSSIFDE